MFCHKCGSKLVNNADFCSICGTKVSAPASTTTLNSNNLPQYPSTSANKVAPPKSSANISQSDTNEYRDYICPNCGEKVSYRPDDATNNKVVCPMCDHQFLVSFPKPPQSPTNTAEHSSLFTIGMHSDQTTKTDYDINHHPVSEAGAQYRAYYNQSIEKPIISPKSPNYTNIRPRTIASISMGWHKFLIYFSLWVSAIGNILSGLQHMTGALYFTFNPYTGEINNISSQVYNRYDGLQIIDILFGLCFIFNGVYFIFARNALANYKENGPKHLRLAYLYIIFDNTLYIAIVQLLSDGDLFNSLSIISLIGTVVITIVNHIYYKNRDYMFYE